MTVSSAMEASTASARKRHDKGTAEMAKANVQMQQQWTQLQANLAPAVAAFHRLETSSQAEEAVTESRGTLISALLKLTPELLSVVQLIKSRTSLVSPTAKCDPSITFFLQQLQASHKDVTPAMEADVQQFIQQQRCVVLWDYRTCSSTAVPRIRDRFFAEKSIQNSFHVSRQSCCFPYSACCSSTTRCTHI
jgi:hypothetical protein